MLQVFAEVLGERNGQVFDLDEVAAFRRQVYQRCCEGELVGGAASAYHHDGAPARFPGRRWFFERFLHRVDINAATNVRPRVRNRLKRHPPSGKHGGRGTGDGSGVVRERILVHCVW